MTSKETLFFAEMYSLVKKMEQTIEEFEMKDSVLAAIVVGVLDLDAIESGSPDAGNENYVRLQLGRREGVRSH